MIPGLPEIQAQVTDMVVPITTVIVILVAGLYLRGVAADIAAGLAFRRRGFLAFEAVEIDDARAVIVSIGLRNTAFQMPSGDDMEYLIVPNTRLIFHNIKKLAPRT